MTTSTATIYTMLRTQILGFLPLDGSTPVSASIGPNRFFMPGSTQDSPFGTSQAPNTSPYATMRLTGGKTTADIQLRQERDLEIMLYARPKNQQIVLENVADKIEQSMLLYTSPTTSAGLVTCRMLVSRDVLPPPPDPADRDVCTVRLVFRLIVFPQYMIQYSTQ